MTIAASNSKSPENAVFTNILKNMLNILKKGTSEQHTATNILLTLLFIRPVSC